MKKEQRQIYVAPKMKVRGMRKLQRIVATSGGESFSQDNGSDGTGNDY